MQKIILLHLLTALLLFLPNLTNAVKQGKGISEEYKKSCRIKRTIMPQHGKQLIEDAKSGLFYYTDKGRPPVDFSKFPKANPKYTKKGEFAIFHAVSMGFMKGFSPERDLDKSNSPKNKCKSSRLGRSTLRLGKLVSPLKNSTKRQLRKK